MSDRPATAAPWFPDAAAIFLAALILRGIGLGAESFWGDVMFTWAWTQLGQDFIWGEGRLRENNPPLYFSLAAAWRGVAGGDEWGLRSLSAVASALAAIVCYATGRVLLRRRT